MPKYFFSSRANGLVVVDDEGQDFDNVERAIAHAVVGARSLMAHQVTHGVLDLDGAVNITADEGVAVATVTFPQALSVIR